MRLEMIKHPRAVVTFSDSGAHVSQIMDSSLQTHLLSHWVRAETSGDVGRSGEDAEFRSSFAVGAELDAACYVRDGTPMSSFSIPTLSRR